MGKNKTGKYFKYAIGEIILVVIGILIALQINNLNQERLKAEKFRSTLVEIQSDIALDIRSCNIFTGRYIERDSIKNLIFNNRVTYDDIKSGRIDASRAAFKYDLMNINREGYEKFRLEVDDIPEQYNELAIVLNRQYNVVGNYLEDLALGYREKVTKNRDYRIDHLEWFSQDLFTNTISDEQIDFYLNDPKYMDLVMYMSDGAASLFIAINNYRYLALRSYFLIEDLLSDQAFETPEIIRQTTLADAQEADHIIGIYKISNGPSNTTFGDEIKITSQGKDLFIETNNEGPWPLNYWHPDKLEFLCYMAGRSVLIFSSKTPNRLKIINGNIDQTEWEKVLDQ